MRFRGSWRAMISALPISTCGRSTRPSRRRCSPISSPVFLREKVGIARDFGAFPRDRLNPNGGSIALGHPFGATGARILSQAVKELAERHKGERAIVSICTDGGQGGVALLEAA